MRFFPKLYVFTTPYKMTIIVINELIKEINFKIRTVPQTDGWDGSEDLDQRKWTLGNMRKHVIICQNTKNAKKTVQKYAKKNKKSAKNAKICKKLAKEKKIAKVKKLAKVENFAKLKKFAKQ